MTAAEVDRESRIADWVAGQLRVALRRRSWWVVAAAVVFAAVAIKLFGRQYIFFDMAIYHGAVEWWLAGGELYDYVSPSGLGFTYPPFAAMVMLPMAVVPATVAGWINVIGSVAVLGVVLALLLRPIAARFGWPWLPTVGVALALAIALEPTRETLGFGQVNLLLFGLVMADLLALRWAARAVEARRRGRRAPAGSSGTGVEGFDIGGSLRRLWFSGAWAGVGIGLATAVKLTPGLFILYLLVSKQRKPALVASGTAAGASLVTWLLAPHESTTYFTSVLWQTDRVGVADFTPNQSLAGVLARLYDSTETPGLLWLSFAALCCAVGLSRAVSAHKEGDELASFTLVGLTATVISPISWSHHLVFVIPALLILGDAALRRHAAASRGIGPGSALAGLPYAAIAAATYIVFVISPIWWFYHRLPLISHYANGVPGVLAENSLALGIILLVAVMPWRQGAAPGPAYMSGWQAWTLRRSVSAVGSSGSTVAARSRTSSPAPQTAGS
jgi:alpha-1,2-mannosyltransferase